VKTVLLRYTTDKFTADNLWHRVRDIETYPQRIKFCKKVYDIDFKHGGSYTDVTTLLWIPATVRHEIVSAKYPTEIKYSLKMPLGATSQHSFRLKRKNGKIVLLVEVTFDLGHPRLRLLGNIVSYILARRLVTMLKSGFPEEEPEVFIS
jgi:hypothetical protein